jgi:hypothetical protein
MILARLLGCTACLISATIATANDGKPISLRCDGTGYDTVPTASSSAAVIGPDGIGAVGSSRQSETVRREMTVLFRSDAQGAEINIRGKWHKVKSLKIEPQEVTGAVGSRWTGDYSYFRIDRVSGAISSEGGFSGMCQRVEAGETKF